MRALEPILLRDAESLSARVADADRGAITDTLALGRQKVQAGDALWNNGHVAEGLRLGREALDATLEAAPLVARATGDGAPGEIASILAKRGLSPAAIARVIDVRARAHAEALPPRDAEVSRTHAALYDAMQLARRDVDRALDPASRPPRTIRLERAGRIALAVLAVLIVVGAAAFALWPRHGLHAEASAQFGTGHTFAPSNAIDGQPETEWLLPDAVSGHVEVRSWPAQRVERVVLLNARNPPYHDRASREYRVELFAGDRSLRTIEGAFESLERDPEPVAIDVGIDGVDRVRVTIVSWHGLGGGLAEITIEPR